MKESLSGLWNYLSTGWAKRFMKRWLTWVRRSGLPPMRKVAEMLSRHLDNILAFCRHRITNGAAEGLNSKIMALKRRARGYRNREHFKTALSFYPEIGVLAMVLVLNIFSDHIISEAPSATAEISTSPNMPTPILRPLAMKSI